jgi:hypothetical protein
MPTVIIMGTQPKRPATLLCLPCLPCLRPTCKEEVVLHQQLL